MDYFSNHKSTLNHAKPYLAVIFLQFGRAGNAIISKFALNQGMSHYTLVVYRNIIASLVFAPFAYYFERKIRPQMTFSIIWKISLLALLEPVIDQNLYYAGLKYTTATSATALCNILPALTFLLAWLLRLEKVSIKRLHSQLKVFGTLVTVGGAMIMTLVGGPILGFPWTKNQHHQHQQQQGDNNEVGNNSIKGSIMITLGCFCWASFYILQAITLKTYPAGLSLTTLLCMAGALQGTLLTLAIEPNNTEIWSLHWDSTLLAYAYSGIVCSGVAYYISGVIMEDKGPVFVTAFNPLTMVIVAVLGSLILAEQLCLGSVLGAVVIVFGLYLFIWGKSKDQFSSSSSSSSSSSISANCDKITPEDHILSNKEEEKKEDVTQQVSGTTTTGEHAV